MEKFINICMATVTSFLTCIAPVAAVEHSFGTYSFHCSGQLGTMPIELSKVTIFGKVDHQGAQLVIQNGPQALPEFISDVEVAKLRNYDLDLETHPKSFAGYRLRIQNFYLGSNFSPEAEFRAKSEIHDYERLTCKTSCSQCSQMSHPDRICQIQCHCSAPFCGAW